MLPGSGAVSEKAIQEVQNLPKTEKPIDADWRFTVETYLEAITDAIKHKHLDELPLERLTNGIEVLNDIAADIHLPDSFRLEAVLTRDKILEAKSRREHADFDSEIDRSGHD